MQVRTVSAFPIPLSSNGLVLHCLCRIVYCVLLVVNDDRGWRPSWVSTNRLIWRSRGWSLTESSRTMLETRDWDVNFSGKCLLTFSQTPIETDFPLKPVEWPSAGHMTEDGCLASLHWLHFTDPTSTSILYTCGDLLECTEVKGQDFSKRLRLQLHLSDQIQSVTSSSMCTVSWATPPRSARTACGPHLLTQ